MGTLIAVAIGACAIVVDVRVAPHRSARVVGQATPIAPALTSLHSASEEQEYDADEER